MYVTISPAGGGELYFPGHPHQSLPLAPPAESRAFAISVIAARARQLGHPIDVEVDDITHHFTLRVHGDESVDVVASTKRQKDAVVSPHVVSDFPPLDIAVAEDFSSLERTPRMRAELEFGDGHTVVVEGTDVIGRKPSAPPQAGEVTLVALGEGYHLLSRTHGLVSVANGTVTLTDLHSRNGSHLERGGEITPIPPGSPIRLHNGDTVHLGDSAARVRIEQDMRNFA